jgi:hypothetical protein
MSFNFLPHSRCTRRTDDWYSSVCAKASDQRLLGTANRGRSASPCVPNSQTARWRRSLRKTWSSIPAHRCKLQPRPPPPIPVQHCELQGHVPLRGQRFSTRPHRQQQSYFEMRLRPVQPEMAKSRTLTWQKRQHRRNEWQN